MSCSIQSLDDTHLAYLAVNDIRKRASDGKFTTVKAAAEAFMKENEDLGGEASKLRSRVHARAI